MDILARKAVNAYEIDKAIVHYDARVRPFRRVGNVPSYLPLTVPCIAA